MGSRKVSVRLSLDESVWRTTLGHKLFSDAIREYFAEWGISPENVEIEFVQVKRPDGPKAKVGLLFTPDEEDDLGCLHLSSFLAMLWVNLIGTEFEDIRVDLTKHDNRLAPERV